MLGLAAFQVLEDEILHKEIVSEIFLTYCLFCFFACLAHISFKLVCKSNRYVNLYLLRYVYGKASRTNELTLVDMFK